LAIANKLSQSYTFTTLCIIQGVNLDQLNNYIEIESAIDKSKFTPSERSNWRSNINESLWLMLANQNWAQFATEWDVNKSQSVRVT
jgi:hypothetical protein